MDQKRCRWVPLDDPLYVAYHDEEWGVPLTERKKLFGMLVLEGFQAGLSWRTILHKRQAFIEAFDGFDPDIVASYGERKVASLLSNPRIVRSEAKIRAVVTNAKAYLAIEKECGSFAAYLSSFAPSPIIERGKTTSPLAEKISADLRKRGMKYVGPTIVYSYLQAIGIVFSHDEDCFVSLGKSPAK